MNCTDHMTPEQKRAYCRRNHLIAAVRKAYAKGELSDEAVRKLESEGIALEAKRRGTLAEERPDLLEEWDWEENEKRGLRPDEVTAGSGHKAWWRHWHEESRMWHRWETAIANRALNDRGCPVCAGKKVLKGCNDLATTHPELLEEWDWEENEKRGLRPDEVTAGSGDKACWKHWHEESKMWHKWEAVIGDRTSNGQGCSVCAGRKVLKDSNDLATTHPELLEEWDWEENEKRGLRPDEVTAGSSKVKACWKHWHEESKMWHKWEALIPNRALKDSGCPVCSGRKLLKGSNDLATTHPELLEEWDWEENEKRGLRPDEVTAGSRQPACWKHWDEESKMWHRWEARICNRALMGSGCPVCSGNMVLKGSNDLATKMPHIAAQWHPTKNGELLPSDVMRNYIGKIWWRCPNCGHEWPQTIQGRIDQYPKRPCPKCLKEPPGFDTVDASKVLKAKTFLVDAYPEVAAQWHPTKNGNRTAEDAGVSSSKPVWWRCPNCGHEWDQYIQCRIKQYPNKPCPECRKEPPGFDTLNRTEERPAAQDKPS